MGNRIDNKVKGWATERFGVDGDKENDEGIVKFWAKREVYFTKTFLHIKTVHVKCCEGKRGVDEHDRLDSSQRRYIERCV